MLSAHDSPSHALKRKQPEPPPAATVYFGPIVEKRGRNGLMEQKMEGFLSRTHTFQQWLAANLSVDVFLYPAISPSGAPPLPSPTSAAVRIMRQVLSELEVHHSLQHFHFKIQNPFDFEKRRSLPGCTLTVLTGGHPDGPLATTRCMSCDLSCPLALGVGGSSSVDATSADSLLSETKLTRVWIDAKARPMLVFTPVRHVQRLSDLDDCEFHDLLHSIHTALTTRGLHVQCAIVNHGDFRNHAHLHVKVRFSPRVFENALRHWSQDEQQKLERIRSFAASIVEQQKLERIRASISDEAPKEGAQKAEEE
jgi:hypothetical protein